MLNPNKHEHNLVRQWLEGRDDLRPTHQRTARLFGNRQRRLRKLARKNTFLLAVQKGW